MALSLGTFKFILQTPSAKILECRAGSVVVPACDGQMGILRNHVPMIATLKLGVLQVRDVVYEKGLPDKDKFFLIEGGFVKIGENNVSVLAYDVDTFMGMPREDIVRIVEQAKSFIAGDKYSKNAARHNIEKASAIIQLSKMSGILDKYGH